MDKYAVGDIIRPYPGGGQYGRCRKCEREGLQIIEVPSTPIIKPKGWSKLPTE